MLAGPQSNPVVPQKSTEHAQDIDMEQRECSSLMESGCTGEIHAQRKRMREGNDSEDEESDVNNYESSESEDYGYSSDPSKQTKISGSYFGFGSLIYQSTERTIKTPTTT